MTAIVPTRISGTSIFYTQRAVEENGQGIYFYPLDFYSHEYIHSSDDPQKNWFLQNENLKGCEKQNSTTGLVVYVWPH